MKKSKILLVTVLALVLCLLCVTTSTFSWLLRPKELNGNALGWNPSYETSVGKDISMKTYELTEDGKEYDEPQEVASFSNQAGTSSGHRKYYRTDIINSGTEAQSVSLFLSSVDGLKDSPGKFCLGVNGPLKTYKNYSNIYGGAGTKVQSTINEKYVYLGLHAAEETEGKFNNKIDRIHAWNNDISLVSKSPWDNRLATGKTGSWVISGKWNDAAQTFSIYAMKVDYRCTDFQLKGAGDENSGWYDVKPKISDNNTLVFYEYGNNYIVEAKKSGTAAGLESFYSTASVAVGDTVDLAAKGQGTITYASSNTNVATVNSSGVVTGVKAGSATITVTSTGAYGETITSSCTLTVQGNDSDAVCDVPIVTNVRVAAATESGDTVESVYWYIKNEGSGVLTYTIDDIYLTL